MLDRETKEVLNEFESIGIATKETNILHISECCSNKRKSAGGYLWRYAND